ncbi:MAG: helix-turn-helix domain-containing protein [Patescibacteria group bacterium]
MSIQSTLEKTGLSQKESLVYTALLELGASSVVGIAKKSGLKRPTVYLVLDELVKKGFISEVPEEKKRRFIALSPENIVDSFDQRARELRKMLPHLLDFYQGQSERPVIRFFNSHEGMMSVYREVTKKGSTQEILSFVSPENVPEEFNENWDMFLRLFSGRGAKGREIFSISSLEHPYVRQVKKIPNYQARVASAESLFPSDTIVYGDKVALLSFKKGFAIIIESADVAKSLRSLFELAWQSARPL